MHASHGANYRLYIDESGDPVYTNGLEPSMRYLALLGVWFKRPGPYLAFSAGLEKLKLDIFGPSPTGKPVVLHRKDIMQRRGPFGVLRDSAKLTKFDDRLLQLISDTDFRMTCVVIDKSHHQTLHPNPNHPYHYCMEAMLQRYCGWLDRHESSGDVAVESRGYREDAELKLAYAYAIENGIRFEQSENLQRTLSSADLSTCLKQENIAGLQLSDILANPARAVCLAAAEIITPPPPSFSTRLMEICRPKLNYHSDTGRTEDYGTVWLSRSPHKPEVPFPSMTRRT